MAENSSPSLMTIAETAAFTRLTTSTIRAWIGKRKIPFVKLGRRVFIRRIDLENLIASSVVPARRDLECLIAEGRVEREVRDGQ